MAAPHIKDYQWARQAFLVKAEQLETIDQNNRFLTSALYKFTDTTLGGNRAINPAPQFTHTADIVVPNLYNASTGMGRYYSEAIDDNAQIVHMRFGVPQFNSLTTFFTGFYNSGAGQLARTGRAGSIFYNVGRAAAFVVTIATWPIFLATYGIQMGGLAYRFFLGKPASKFYYMKPTMPLYWNAVTTIVNHIAVNKGIVPRIGEEEGNMRLGLGLTKEDRSVYSKLMPSLFDEDGGIDVYKLATRAKRLERQFRRNYDEAFNLASKDIAEAVRRALSPTLRDNKPSLHSYLDRWFNNKRLSEPGGQTAKTAETNNAQSSAEIAKANSSEALEAMPEFDPKRQEDDGMLDLFEGEMDDGSAFVSFRVNYTGSVSESFSNSVGESEIASTINNMSSQSRNTNFNFAGGNVSDLIAPVLNAGKDIIAGVAQQLNIQGLASLAGSAFVDIPKHWQSSMASLPRSTYTINLNSPYGNPISRFINQDIPLAMLLAGALPLSTGKQSYTSPFLCEIYDQGRCQTRLGMIDSLSITRGTGNLGFTNDGRTLGIEVSFSVVDLSSIMHMPISEGFSFSPDTAFFDEDNTFTDYMAVLASLSLGDQINPLRKLKINLSRQMQHWDTFWSKSHFVNSMSDIGLVRMMSAFYKGRE